jgi:hypothetical protein
MKYETVTQDVSFGKTVFVALISGRKYGVISQIGKCLTLNNVRTSIFRNEVRYQNVTPLQNSI